jgi:cation transport ATPase
MTLAGRPAFIPEARATRRAVHGNFAWAFGYNAFLLPPGLDLMPAAAMAIASFTVALDSLRLSRA